MAPKEEDLSHEEVWDDSLLIDSWNDALAEYKKYHSIHAKGGSIRDLEAEISPTDEERQSHKEADSAGNEDPEGTTSHPEQTQPSQRDATASASVAPPTQALLSSIRDDNLKKLLMSWYYAGYYTGLFEGQQQAQQAQEPQS